jgi:hypothetical protein
MQQLFISTTGQNRKVHKAYPHVLKDWQMVLFERVINLFDWEGLPDTLPEREIEARLHGNGIAFVYDFKQNGKPYVFNTNSANISNIYTDIPLSMNLQSVIWSDTVKTSEGVLIRNNSTCLPTMTLINIYADKLAHCDLTMVNMLVNMRAKNVPIASTSKMVDRLRAWRANLFNGSFTSIEDPSFMGVDTVNIDTGTMSALRELAEVRQNILNEFYNSIGIRNQYVKKAQQTDDEISAGDTMLKINITDMLDYRQMAAEAINERYGLNCSVDFNEEIKAQFREVKEYDNTQTDL